MRPAVLRLDTCPLHATRNLATRGPLSHHYVVFMECARVVPKEKIQSYRDIIEDKLAQANPSFGSKVRTGVFGPTELVFVQPETYQLYRDVMIMKGTSPNQLKPVRVIDTPLKERFFFGLKETYEEESS